jgi:hypothetical protein
MNKEAFLKDIKENVSSTEKSLAYAEEKQDNDTIS